MKTGLKLLVLLLSGLTFLSAASAMENGVYRDKAPGYGGDVIVKAVVRDGRIIEITTENTGGEKSEYYLLAEETLTEAIIAANGLDGVDTVAGATGTSESILTAMRGILEQAAYTGAPLESLNQMAEDAKDTVLNAAEDVKDGAENIADDVKNGAEDAVNSVREPSMTADPKPTV